MMSFENDSHPFQEEQEICENGSSLQDLDAYDKIAWWLEGVLLIIIGIMGFIGNLLAIPILVSRKMSNVFNRTLAFLAFFDTAFIVLDVLESVRQYYEDNGGRVHDFHIRLFPHMLYPLQNIAMVASIYLTVVIAMERYRAVSKPLTSFIGDAEGGRWRRVFAYVGPVLVFSVMFNLPTFFEFYAEDVSEINDDGLAVNSTKMRISELRSDRWYILLYINFGRNTVTGLVPFFTLSILNYLVYSHLKGRRNTMAQITEPQSSNAVQQMKVERRQAHTLFGVVSLFFIGHAVRIVLNLHEIFAVQGLISQEQDYDEEDYEYDYDDYESNPCITPLPLWSLVMKSVCRLLITIASSANLLIYCMASRPFRRLLWKRLRIFRTAETGSSGEHTDGVGPGGGATSFMLRVQRSSTQILSLRSPSKPVQTYGSTISKLNEAE